MPKNLHLSASKTLLPDLKEDDLTSGVAETLVLKICLPETLS